MKCFVHLPLLYLGAVLLTATGQLPLAGRQALLDAHNDWRAVAAYNFGISNMKQVVSEREEFGSALSHSRLVLGWQCFSGLVFAYAIAATATPSVLLVDNLYSCTPV